jgi:hypothetical protein
MTETQTRCPAVHRGSRCGAGLKQDGRAGRYGAAGRGTSPAGRAESGDGSVEPCGGQCADATPSPSVFTVRIAALDLPGNRCPTMESVAVLGWAMSVRASSSSNRVALHAPRLAYWPSPGRWCRQVPGCGYGTFHAEMTGCSCSMPRMLRVPGCGWPSS